MKYEYRIFVYDNPRSPSNFEFSILRTLATSDGSRKHWSLTDDGWVDWKEEDMFLHGSLAISRRSETLQDLANILWGVGIQPEQAKGSAGQLGAVSRHLEDMRALVFKTGKP